MSCPSDVPASAHQFHLKWNNHHLSMLSVVDSLLKEDKLLDVTLCSSEGRAVRAHRLVLAACSDYFKVRREQDVKCALFRKNMRVTRKRFQEQD